MLCATLIAQQFFRFKGLDDEVFAPGVIALETFFDRVMSRDENHRRAAQRAEVILDLAAQRIAIDAGQVDVEQEEIGFFSAIST